MSHWSFIFQAMCAGLVDGCFFGLAWINSFDPGRWQMFTTQPKQLSCHSLMLSWTLSIHFAPHFCYSAASSSNKGTELVHQTQIILSHFPRNCQVGEKYDLRLTYQFKFSMLQRIQIYKKHVDVWQSEEKKDKQSKKLYGLQRLTTICSKVFQFVPNCSKFLLTFLFVRITYSQQTALISNFYLLECLQKSNCVPKIIQKH